MEATSLFRTLDMAVVPSSLGSTCCRRSSNSLSDFYRRSQRLAPTGHCLHGFGGSSPPASSSRSSLVVCRALGTRGPNPHPSGGCGEEASGVARRPTRAILALYQAGPILIYTTCSQTPDDRRPPAISSDWRSFRARLVAGEKPEVLTTGSVDLTTSAAAAPVVLGDKWAHPLHEPERGCLLIATEKLDGVHIFERTVILLLSSGPLGPAGIILNRPSLMSIKETRSTDLDVAGTFSDRPLFFGGPLEDGIFLLKPTAAEEGDQSDSVGRSGVFEEVMRGVYYGTKESVGCAAEMVKRGAVGAGDFRFFDGYCGWEREQLREEIRAGYWTVAACGAAVIGLDSAAAAGVGMWEEVLGLVGEKKKLF